MEIKLKLNIRAEQLFSVMKNSLIQEVKALRKYDVHQIGRGFTYVKANKTKVQIKEWKEPELYEVSFQKGEEQMIVRYEIHPQSEKSCLVLYSEIHKISGKVKTGWKEKLTEKKEKKNAIQLLKNVEKLIQNANK